ncbi:MAG: putative toxin-antitoxin system toxin component, PIN family [Terracidiphilus sp.]
MIVVLDTNVWISALEFGGTPDRAVFRAVTQDRLAISEFIQSEIVRVMTRKFGRDERELRPLLDELFLRALRVEVAGVIRGVCRDPKDDAILETAWRAEADYLIAGDRDLLSLGRFGKSAIVTPAAYLQLS